MSLQKEIETLGDSTINSCKQRKEFEVVPFPFKTEVLNVNGTTMQTGGKELYWEHFRELEELVIEVFGEEVNEWLDLAAIPAILEGGVAILCKNEEGQTCGFIHGRPKGLVNGIEGRSIWIGTVIAANPPGQGIGGLLVETFKNEARNLGARAWFMRTDPSRKKAINFYKKHGFKEAGTIDGFYLYGTELAPALWLRADF